MSPFADRRLMALAVVGLLAICAYGFLWWQEGADRLAVRSQLLADTAIELAKDEPVSDRLSELMAGLAGLPDASTEPEIMAARAAIELSRGRAERADHLFGAIAASPGALPSDQRLGARILLAKHAGFGGDPVMAEAMLQEVIAMSEVAYSDSGDVRDLFRSWQAATRLWDHERAEQFAAQLQLQHADSPQSQLVTLLRTFDPAQHKVQVADLVADFAHEPVELSAMSTVVALAANDVSAALDLAMTGLNVAPGVPGVRFVAALVLHACAAGHAAGSTDRATFVARRNAQLDWLEVRAPVSEPQRQKWQLMRRQLP